MERRHPSHGDLYTPMTPEVHQLFAQMKLEHGTYRRICLVSNTRLKVFRNLRNGRRKAISMRLLDRLITTTGVGALDDFLWFTADDLVALGIWDPVLGVERKKDPKRLTKAEKRRKREKAEKRAYQRRLRLLREGRMPWE